MKRQESGTGTAVIAVGTKAGPSLTIRSVGVA